MVRARSRSSSSIFFPWERRGGVRRLLGLGRVRPVIVAALLLAFILLVASRERRQAGIRQTRATLLGVRKAVDAYMAENAGRCPEGLARVLDFGSFKELPHDAWGNPLRLVCPSRRPGERYELLSDGPDGRPGGLDRIE
ncbi:MAG TPA: type II secretion system protein GspG [Polyangiaceae bacterium]|nr:type II secretion system protein GspG [Polyangiaceae bacterium]